MRGFLPTAFLTLALAVAAPALAGAEPVGLVLKVEGRIERPVAPFSELAADTRLALARGARVEVAYYPTCEVVSFAGAGAVTFGASAYAAERAAVTVLRTRCPTRLRLRQKAGAGGEVEQPAGMVMRGGLGVETVAMRPRIVLSGPGAAKVRRIRIAFGSREVATLPVEEGRPVWPGALELAPGSVYDLALVFSDGAEAHAAIKVRAAPGDGSVGDVLILSVE